MVNIPLRHLKKLVTEVLGEEIIVSCEESPFEGNDEVTVTLQTSMGTSPFVSVTHTDAEELVSYLVKGIQKLSKKAAKSAAKQLELLLDDDQA